MLTHIHNRMHTRIHANMCILVYKQPNEARILDLQQPWTEPGRASSTSKDPTNTNNNTSNTTNNKNRIKQLESNFTLRFHVDETFGSLNPIKFSSSTTPSNTTSFPTSSSLSSKNQHHLASSSLHPTNTSSNTTSNTTSSTSKQPSDVVVAPAFDRSALYERNRLPRGEAVAGVREDKDRDFFRSVHLGGTYIYIYMSCMVYVVYSVLCLSNV